MSEIHNYIINHNSKMLWYIDVIECDFLSLPCFLCVWHLPIIDLPWCYFWPLINNIFTHSQNIHEAIFVITCDIREMIYWHLFYACYKHVEYESYIYHENLDPSFVFTVYTRSARGITISLRSFKWRLYILYIWTLARLLILRILYDTHKSFYRT